MGVVSKASIVIAILIILSFGSSSAQLIVGLTVGNLDGIPIYADTGQIITVPVWAYSYDSIWFVHIPIATDDYFVAARLGGTLYFPFDSWDDCSFLAPYTDSPVPGYTSQCILGFADLDEEPNPCLFTDGQWIHVADILMRTTSNPDAVGDTMSFVEGYDPDGSGLIFGSVYHGVLPVEQLEVHWGRLILRPQIIDGIPGDVNHSNDVNGLDVVWLVNYLKGYGTPPIPIIRGDTNGDCNVNGLDVVYLVNYLKGIGPAPFWGNCP